MKRKISKILGVGLTLAMLLSMLVVAAPVSADVTQPSVTVSPTTISAANPTYTVRLTTNQQLTGGTTAVAGGAYELAEVGDAFTLTSTGAGTVTFTQLNGSTVAVAVTAPASFAAPVITFTAAGQVATVTVATVGAANGRCNGTMADTAGTAAAVTVGGAADTITMVLPSDTAVIVGPTATITAAPGWVNSIWVNATTSPIAPAGTVATRTVVTTLNAGDRIGEGAEIRMSFTAGFTNPSAIGTYTLTVATSKETTAVTSTAYSITAPVVGALEGIVQVKNPAGILINQFTGPAAITNAMAVATAANYLIEIGPGTYDQETLLDPVTTGLMVKATGTAAETIIIGNFTLDQAGTTLDGLTIKGTVTITAVNAPPAARVIVQNCLFSRASATAAATTFVNVNNATAYATVQDNTLDSSLGAVADQLVVITTATSVSVTGNSFIIDETVAGVDDTAVQIVGAVAAPNAFSVTNNTFAGASGFGVEAQNAGPVTITGNTFTGLQQAIWASAATAAPTLTVTGNLIENGTKYVTATTASLDVSQVNIDGAATGSIISGNDIDNNAGYSVDVAANANLVSVIGNNFSTNTYGLRSTDGANTLNATLNNWGVASGPTITTNLGGTGDKITATGAVTYKPWATVGASQISLNNLAATGGTIDKSTTVGIAYTSAGTTAATTVTLAKYTANPAISAPPYTALADAYFDVYSPGATGTQTILFYATGITANTRAYYYSVLQQQWWPCSTVAVAGNNAYVIVTIGAATAPTNGELNGTPFVLVSVPPAPVLTITSPAAGVTGVILNPTLVWGASAAAISYQVEFTEDPTFAILMQSRNTANAFYSVDEDLDYATTYYWRVRAQTAEAENLGAGLFSGLSATVPVGPWTTGVFTTMAEPVESVVGDVIIEADEPAIVNVEVAAPEVTVEPSSTTVEAAIPDYLLWVIVAVGAILIIALIVLIVRTRRVA